MRRITRWLRLWFTFESGVGRREYFLSGVGLGLLKYAGDVLMVWRANGRIWQPLDYLSTLSTLMQTRLAMAPQELLPLLATYADIAPPHLDGYFRSRRGEFRLVALPGGRTRLEGSTWYEMKLQPAAYWVLYGDAIIARIHRRVLRHIKATAESR